MQIGSTKITIARGDITQQDTDAIVNAANSSLMGGGGVDGAIHRAGGQKILEECREIRRTKLPDGLPSGDAVITSAGNLRARFVIHTVGPIWGGGTENESEILKNCYNNSLTLCEAEGIESISFPSISTGAYGYPISLASEIALRSVKRYLENHETVLKEVRFVLFSGSDLSAYNEKADIVFSDIR